METLPPELLALVCQNVKKDYQPSLISFALTSKQCYAAATKERFRNVQITIKDAETLKSDVSHILDVLKASSSLKHVRQLKIQGSMCGNTKPSHSSNTSQDCKSSMKAIPWYDPKDLLTEDWVSEPVENARQSADIFWSPLATLVGQLPCLAITEFVCKDQIPSCLLRALEGHPNPQTTLRLNSGVNAEIGHLARIVLSSPLLSCITMHRNTKTLIEESLVGSILSTSSPNLEEVRLICDGSGFGAPAPSRFSSVLPWYGQDRSGAKQTLRILRFASRQRSNGDNMLQSWHRRTDLARLEVLDLRCHVGMPMLHWATLNAPFVALTDLYIESELFRSSDAGLYHAAEAFLLSLPTLQGLSMCGIPKLEVLSTILSHHGSTLRRLHFRPVMHDAPNRSDALNEIELIRDLCPNIQHLTFHVRRRRGDAREVAVYKFLGTLRNLTRLSLSLDASMHLSYWPTINHIQGPSHEGNGPHLDKSTFLQLPFNKSRPHSVLNGHICENLVNSTVDATLAKSILHVIAESKSPNSLPLQILKVCPIGAGSFGPIHSPTGLDEVFEETARSWAVMPSPRDDQVGMLIAQELAPARQFQGQFEEPKPLLANVDRVFRRIWPDQGSGDWRDKWKSIPLAGS